MTLISEFNLIVGNGPMLMLGTGTGGHSLDGMPVFAKLAHIVCIALDKRRSFSMSHVINLGVGEMSGPSFVPKIKRFSEP